MKYKKILIKNFVYGCFFYLPQGTKTQSLTKVNAQLSRQTKFFMYSKNRIFFEKSGFSENFMQKI